MSQIAIVALCLIVNAFFACFEMAFVTVTKTQLRQLAKKGVRAAEHILSLRENPERTLSVIQVGITLVGMISAAVGGAGAEESFAPLLEAHFGLSESASEVTAISLVVIPLTALNVVLGELVPKSIALRDPLRVSLLGARWIKWVDRLFSPLVSLLEKATKLILFLLPRRKPPAGIDSPAQIDIDHLSQHTQQYVVNLMGIETQRVRDVMVPWTQVNWIDESDPIERITESVVRYAHTRLPVCRDGRVIGILHAKEFIALIATVSDDWRSIIRPAIEVRENDLALPVLRHMQDRRSHLSIVVSDKGEPKGIVTIEDVLEEIIGEVFDEDDDGRIRRLMSRQSRMMRS